MSDELTRTVEAAKRGDPRAFNALVQLFQGRSIALAYTMLGDFHLAQDVAQDCLLEAYRALPTLEAPSAFSGWLHTIVLRRCFRLRRRKQIDTVPIHIAFEDDVYLLVSRIDRNANQEAVDAAIAALPHAQQEVIRMYYIDGHSQEEIAVLLKTTTNTVKKRLQTARKALRVSMKAAKSGRTANP